MLTGHPPRSTAGVNSRNYGRLCGLRDEPKSYGEFLSVFFDNLFPTNFFRPPLRFRGLGGGYENHEGRFLMDVRVSDPPRLGKQQRRERNKHEKRARLLWPCLLFKQAG